MYITYNKINEIRSFFNWLHSEWYFVNKDGIREWGQRFFGITFSNYSDKQSEKKKMNKLREKQLKKLGMVYK